MADFSQSLISALLRGQQYARNKRIEREETEDRDLEKQILQHRVKELKIQDQIRARTAAKENLTAMEGMPEASFPWGGERMKPGPAPRGLPPGDWQFPDRDIPTVDIPGIDELGIPGFSQKPQTMEELLTQEMLRLRQRTRNTPQSASRGERIVLPAFGDEPEEVLSEGDPYPESQPAPTRYVTRAPDGTQTTRFLDRDGKDVFPPAIQHRLPAQPGGGSDITRATQEEIDNVALGFVEGEFPADSAPRATGDFNVRLLNSIKKQGKERGFDLAKAAADTRAFRIHLNSLNSDTEKARIMRAAETAMTQLDELEKIVTAAGDPPTWNMISRNTTNMKNAAQRLAETLAILGAAGSAPTTNSLAEAKKALSTGLFSGTRLGPKLKSLRDSLKLRAESARGAFISVDEAGGMPRQGQPAAEGPADYVFRDGKLVPR